ncbi:hypothetical protein IKG33_02060 [Candidatus Saccharibacteria bacterium]|nr:hypothetical protein [Candidatus Saccharibacteria bacterium]
MKERYIYGSVDKSIGQNVMDAIEGCEQQMSIPPYNYDEMYSIMKKALKPKELDLICRGFGIYRPRQKQYEMAKELGMTSKDVRDSSKDVISKLQKSPYRVQLRKLAPTAEELFDTIEKLEAKTKAAKQDKKETRKVQGLEQSLATAEKKVERLEAENARLTYEIEHSIKKMSKAYAEVNSANAQIVDLMYQLDCEKARSNAATKALMEMTKRLKSDLENFFAKADSDFIGSLNAIEVNLLDRLNLPDNVSLALSRAGLTDVSSICKTQKRVLRKFVGNDGLAVLEKALNENGLSLCAG